MLEGYLIVVEKVKPGDKVRPKDTIHTRLGDLVPEREYMVVDTKPIAYWGNNGNDLIDFQTLTLEGQKGELLSGEFLSDRFDLRTTVISLEALRMLNLSMERQKARAAV